MFRPRFQSPLIGGCIVFRSCFSRFHLFEICFQLVYGGLLIPDRDFMLLYGLSQLLSGFQKIVYLSKLCLRFASEFSFLGLLRATLIRSSTLTNASSLSFSASLFLSSAPSFSLRSRITVGSKEGIIFFVNQISLFSRGNCIYILSVSKKDHYAREALQLVALHSAHATLVKGVSNRC